MQRLFVLYCEICIRCDDHCRGRCPQRPDPSISQHLRDAEDSVPYDDQRSCPLPLRQGIDKILTMIYTVLIT